ncbi:MAG: aminotransferase class V-fold PLP-dependent enzyme, partial [Candidatus Woesearchaeota archaeon]|nr:aminotransferase class V-fold PLP-dependent enzyme [Candidatus Woesearchaeota archaeon]
MQVLSGQLVKKIGYKNSFPLLKQKPKLVYLDSAATTQKPEVTIKAVTEFYEQKNANPHRGVYELSVCATKAYDNSREVVAEFIGALPEEIVFVRNATEGINLVMHSWAKQHVKKGDLILLTEMEHHSNLVPWQQLAKETGAAIEFIQINSEGFLDVVAAQKLIEKKPVIVSFTHVSNVLGTINPVVELVKMAHSVGAKVLLDACQSVAHLAVDVRLFDVDFLVFSGHK